MFEKRLLLSVRLHCRLLALPFASELLDCLRARLCLEVLVEEERIIRATRHGVVVEPRRRVVDAPERDAVDYVGVAKVHFKELAVALRLRLKDVRRASLRVGIVALLVVVELRRIGRETPRVRQHTHIEFRDHRLYAFCTDALNTALVVSYGGPAESVVALKPHAVDPHALRAERAHHPEDAGNLVRIEHVEVVVVELRVRVCLVSEAERELDEVVAYSVAPGRGMESARVVESLVHDVPSVDAPPVASDDSVDVRAHPRDQRLSVGLGTIGVFEEPVWRLMVPHEAVPDDLHPVLLAEGDELVGGIPVELALARLHALGLHLVLGGDGTEVCGDEVGLRVRSLFVNPLTEGSADVEASRVGVLDAAKGGSCRKANDRQCNFRFHA